MSETVYNTGPLSLLLPESQIVVLKVPFVAVSLLVVSCWLNQISLAQESDPQLPSTKQRANPVLNEHIDIHWVGTEDQYAWYEAERDQGQKEVVVIDMTSGERLAAKDFPEGVPKPMSNESRSPATLPELSKMEPSRNGGSETEIELINKTARDVELAWVDADGKSVSYGSIAAGESRKQHTFVNHVWVLRDRNRKILAATKTSARSPASFMLTDESKPPETEHKTEPSKLAPTNRKDKRIQSKHAFIREHNVWTWNESIQDEVALTTDGNDQDGYESHVMWSPSGEHFYVFRIRHAQQRMVTLVDSAPDGQLQPKTFSVGYTKPGDDIDHARLCIFNATEQHHFVMDDAIAPNPFEIRDVSWRADSKAVRFVYNERGHQRLKVIEMNADNGTCRVIVDEKSNTFIDYAGKYFLQLLDDTNELIWMSERDGWNHLYLIDQQTGDVKNQITRGEWVVREVVDVDVSNRSILIAAGGVVADQDPYYTHLLRVSWDGGEPVRLTDGDGDHQWKFSPSRRYFSDRYSRVDAPPTTTLRSLETGALISTAETADASNLLQSGWTLPRRFVAKGRDGVTDIYGLAVLPDGFDESTKYPVLELIYAGPHAAHVPKSFQRMGDLHQAANGAGGKKFIIVRIDGMGTSQRSKAFHDVCWKNLGDGGFPDRIAWIKALAENIPQMDLDRVGIWGGSAGGQNAVRALIAHGDFYKAAFADCGCHDNRMDKIWWNELWMGWPIDAHYEDQSNVTQASRINGKLMLSVGELDTNVDPASTMQMVDALIKANKDFELLFFPGEGHGVGSSAYGTRRRIDFFCRAL